MPTRRPTVVDVALAAGVSRQTVTRAMNDMEGISTATRERVLEAARELRYRPSRFGRGLVGGHRPTLGLVVEGLRNPFFPELADGVVTAATEAGWNVLVTDGSHDGGDAARFLREFAQQVDAVVGYFRVAPAEYDEVFGDLPVVSLEGSTDPAVRGVVEIDFGPGLDAAVAHLVAEGRRRIVMLDEPHDGLRGDGTTRDGLSFRARAYEAAMARHGLTPLVVTEAGDDRAARALDGLQELAPDADALLVFNDVYALAVLKALRSRGVDVPGRCAVLGMDGLAVGAWSSPELTTLDLDIARVGRIAVELATGMHAEQLPAAGPAVRRVVAQTLLLRESA